MENQLLNKRYQIISQIGQGGFGRVYKAWDTVLAKNVAVKIMDASKAMNPHHFARFNHEVAVLSKMHHPNIIEISAFALEKQPRFLVMEFVEGKNLLTLLNQQGRLKPREAVAYLLKICQALEAAHCKNILHRDIKAANIIISYDGEVKICDFGIAKNLDYDLEMTSDNAIIASPYYVAPEILFGDSFTRQSDIYSLGVLAFQLLTGTYPFKARSNNDQGLALNQLQNDIKVKAFPSLRKKVPALSQHLENIIIKATAKSPHNRYHSCQEMMADLAIVFTTSGRGKKKLFVPQIYLPLKAIGSEAEHPLLGKIKLPRWFWGLVLLIIVVIGGIILYVANS